MQFVTAQIHKKQEKVFDLNKTKKIRYVNLNTIEIIPRICTPSKGTTIVIQFYITHKIKNYTNKAAPLN